MTDLDLRHDPDAGRYEAWSDGVRIGVASYRRDSDVVVIPSVVVDPAHRGGGVASALTRFALDDVRASGATRVVPSCPYVRVWIDRHPAYRDLVHGGAPDAD